MRRSTDLGASWGPVLRVVDERDRCARNPVVVLLASGRILLISCLDRADAGVGGRPRGSATEPTRVRVQHSDDDGLRWSAPRDITDGVRMPSWRWYATGPGSVARLASGRILIPANHSEARGVHRAHTFHSDDGGESWSLGGIVDSPLSNEGQLAQRPDGSVLLYLRTRAAGGKEFAVSDDEGGSWHPGPPARELAGPVCQGDLIAVGDELYATGHRHPSVRRGLQLRRSFDGGESWPDATSVRRGRSGYSDLVALPDGLIGVLYEHGSRVAFRVLDPDRAMGRTEPPT